MENIPKLLHLEGAELPAKSDGLTEAFLDAWEDGKKNGYTPVLVFDTKNDPIEELVDGMDLLACREACLADESAFEGRHPAEESEPGECDDEDMEEALLIPEDAKAFLVKIPETEPYRAFAYLPFLGGYGDCPEGAGHIAFARELYQRFGAVPMAVSTDSVQYYVPDCEKIAGDREFVRKIVEYCPSIVEDIPEKHIAAEFGKVHDWFFYWE